MIIEDEQLIQEFKKGNDLAFQKIYEKYFPLAKFFFLKDTLTASDAEDLSQDIFIKLARAMITTEIRSFKGLFYKALLNKKKDLIRLKYRKKVSILSLFQETMPAHHSGRDNRQLLEIVKETSSLNPHEQMQFNELQTIVRECVDKFSNDTRRTIVALKLEGLKEHQIASTLDINPHTVSSNWGRAKLVLRKCISEKLKMRENF